MINRFEELRNEARKVLKEESDARLAFEGKKRDRWLLYVKNGDTQQVAWQKSARDAVELEKEWEIANIEKLAMWYAITRLTKTNDLELI